ncbi:MAG TPA: DUF427 domain-containing protein [Candidatus Acidoferrum sp.]|jgi:uncharacterized protein (DUF427 family)|nr:DUF427 domain-containing protein [Candidatus Acidoferrum sp.]
MKAIWNGTVLAESERTEVVEGNHYFPPETIKREYFKPSETHTVCPWKGTASYYTVAVDGTRNEDAAWYYPQASEEAKNIEGFVAFWKGVEVRP